MRQPSWRTAFAVRPSGLGRCVVVLACATACYTADVSVTAPGVVVERLALVQTAPPLFVRDTVRLNIGDTLRVAFVPLSSGDVAVRDVTLRWDVGSPVLQMLSATEQVATTDARLVAVSSGTTTLSAATSNARTRSGQPLTWRGTVIVR